MLIEKAEDWLHPNLETVFGEEILDLDPHGEYNVHFPIRRGEFNIHSNVGGSLTCVLADLQEIWEYVLQCKMDIKLRCVYLDRAYFFGLTLLKRIVCSDLHAYKAVLVIPDIYHRGHLKELMNLLLTKIGFGSCFFIQVRDFICTTIAFPYLVVRKKMFKTTGSCSGNIRSRSRIRLCCGCRRSEDIGIMCRRWY